ncbi:MULTISPECIES: hypothetical protein [Microvirga]|uniref:hypothetical protein n=1 Tax=Microvirga TaxID=186650 RepID=UPI001D000922|nr:hypothetical protein [Microvirga lenta]MCB5175772.1 hypothetical protein [Microvirga lenta]
MTKRIEELEAKIAELREELRHAEAALWHEKMRQPKIGDYVRCPLTNFYGRVTNVVPRPHGRPWVEIRPFLAEGLPGQGTLDLYDNWELIDPPKGEESWPFGGQSEELPITPIAWPSKGRSSHRLKPKYYLVKW